MVVAIHQPNYLPWLGYFAKIARADTFIFLDDVQFSKGSYINRVQVLGGGEARWLTVPVAVRLGDPINKVRPRDAQWITSHCAFFRNEYRRAAHFRQVWPELEDILLKAPGGEDLAAINQFLIEALSGRLGLSCVFTRSSGFAVAGSSDDRLVELTAAAVPGGTYLSGKGGAKYQDPAKFASAGLGFAYQNFVHPEYGQGPLVAGPFVAGLSVVDAIMHLGWEDTAALLAGERP